MNHPELAPSQPPKSGGALKWVLLGCGGLFFVMLALLGISVYLISKQVTSDPVKVEAAAQEMLTFEKPAGYKGAFSMSMMGTKTAVLVSGEGPNANNGSIVVSVIPPVQGAREQFEKSFKENLEKQGHSQEVSEQRATETFKVRGKEVTAQVAVVNSKGSAARSLQYTVVLDGDSGSTVMLILSGPEKTHDHAWVQKFLDTIK